MARDVADEFTSECSHVFNTLFVVFLVSWFNSCVCTYPLANNSPPPLPPLAGQGIVKTYTGC